jgi:phage gp45-like
VTTTIEDLRDRLTRAAHRARNLVRRVTLSLSNNDGTWQARGYRGFEGAHGDTDGEKFVAEVFPGIGIWARPKVGTVPEAIIVHVGGEPGHPVIVATRQKEMQVALEEDETAVFNSQSVLILKKDGSVEIRSRNGTAQKLVTLAEFNNHTHATAPTGPLTPPTKIASPPGGPFTLPTDGTQKLKAE